MTFIQIEFLWFFAIVFTLYWGVRNLVFQNVVLLVSSCVFYGWVHPWFLTLLFAAAVLDYTLGLCMDRWPGHRRLYMGLSLAGNLGMLGYFKYCDFFIENWITALNALGIHSNLHTLGIFLPVGISFYTFETLSYTIDIYRGELKPRKNFLNYMVFVICFPRLVAGPVERAHRMLPQVEKLRVFTWDAMRSGLGLALWGAFKKVCIADQIAPYVDKVFVHTHPSGGMVWAATLGFAVQILADFSGYTDIGRGLGRMLGFEIVKNFKSPYLSRNPSDFWRRWHVSFSTWIRDYIFIPLGGSKGGLWSTTKATYGAMLISGFWHGASWTYVLWGAFHATLITGYRLVTPRIPAAWRDSRLGDVAAVGIMFAFTCVGWLIFRETHIQRLAHYFTLNPLQGTRDEWIATVVLLAVVLVCSAPMVLACIARRTFVPRFRDRVWFFPVQTAFWGVYAGCILTFARSNANDFIYFQF